MSLLILLEICISVENIKNIVVSREPKILNIRMKRGHKWSMMDSEDSYRRLQQAWDWDVRYASFKCIAKFRQEERGL